MLLFGHSGAQRAVVFDVKWFWRKFRESRLDRGRGHESRVLSSRIWKPALGQQISIRKNDTNPSLKFSLTIVTGRAAAWRWIFGEPHTGRETAPRQIKPDTLMVMVESIAHEEAGKFAKNQREGRMDIEPTEELESLVQLKRPFYSRFDLETFQENVAAFWSSDLSGRAEDILGEIVRTISIGEDWSFPFSWDEYLPGTDFWRVRRVEPDHLRRGITSSDLWEAPRQFVPAGRLNLPEESLLYACMGNPLGPMIEAGLRPDDGFIMIWYRLLEPIVFKRVGLTNPDPDLTDHEQRIEEALSGFIRDVLSIPAEHHGTGIYALTQQVLQQFHPLTPRETGWTYESTLVPDVVNVAIQPKPAHAKLAVNAVIAGRMDCIDQSGISAYYRAHSDGRVRFGNNIGFQYFPENNGMSFEEMLKSVQPRSLRLSNWWRRRGFSGK